MYCFPFYSYCDTRGIEVRPLNIFLIVQYMAIDSKCNLAQQISTVLLSSLIEMHCLFIRTTPSPLFPFSGNHCSTHRFYKYDYFRYHLWMQSCCFFVCLSLAYSTQCNVCKVHPLFAYCNFSFYKVEQYSIVQCTLLYKSTFTIFPPGCCD